MSMLYNPEIRGMCELVRELRDSVLQRCGAIGSIDEESSAQAKAIVLATLAECLGDDKFHAIAEPYYGGNDKALDLLVGRCSDALFDAIPEKPFPLPTRGSYQRRPDIINGLELGISMATVLGSTPSRDRSAA